MVETAFWRPLLFVGAARGDEANKAILAVAMTHHFDDILFGEIVEAGYAFAKIC